MTKQNFPVIDLTPQTAVIENIPSITPKVISFKETTDLNGNSDIFLELELYAPVDVKSLAKNKEDPNSLTPDKIEVRLSEYSTSYFSKKATEKASDKIRNKSRSRRNTKKDSRRSSKPTLRSGTLKPGQLLAAASASSQSSIDSKRNLYSDTILVGNIDLANVTKSVKKEKLDIQKINDSKYKAIANKNIDLDNHAFSRMYNTMIEMNEDPAKIFQLGFNKTSYKHKKNGIINSTNKKDDRHQKVLVPMFESIERSIKTISKNQYVIKTKMVEEVITNLNTKINIHLSKLQNLGSKFYVLLLTKNHLGISLETQSYEVILSDIEDQLEEKSTKYSITPVRLNTGVSVLNIGTSDERKSVDLNLYVKKLKVSKPFDMCYYKSFGTVTVPPNKKIKILDGKLGVSTRTPSNIKSSESAFYRTTLNYKQKSYFNAKSVSDKSRHKNEMTPHLTIVAKISKEDEAFNIEVSSISENVLAIRPRKCEFKGDTRATSALKPIFFEEDGRPLERFTSVSTTRFLKFKDFDVYRTKNYKYVVECIMKNGEKKLASAYFIEKFEERTGILRIDNFETLNVDYTPDVGGSDLSDTDDINSITRRITGSFLVTQTSTQMDDILRSMFGNLFELFKDKLKTVRSITSTVKSIQIDRIDHATGNMVSVDIVTPDEGGLCRFVDSSAPVYSDITYKIIPRMAPTQDLITEIQEILGSLSATNIFQTSIFNLASSNVSQEENRQNIVSRVGTKYSKRNTFLKGLIPSPKYTANREGFDLFVDNSTGDVAYFDVGGIDIVNTRKDISVFGAEISLINEEQDLTYRTLAKPLQQKGATKIRDIKSRKTCYYDLSFDVLGNDAFVDFYLFFIKENNEVYMDGIMHSIDSYAPSVRYSYLVTHNGSFGLAEYYVVPFYKDGMFSSPKFITAQKLY